MKPSEYIVEVSEVDFEYEVIAYSQQTPVVVDFWAEWCGPCRTLGPILEKLAEEAAGNFRLAKINVDENPNLSIRYNVRSIPAVKAFRHGQVVSEFVGVQPESRIREFIRALAPSKADLTLEKAKNLLTMNQWLNAETAFRQVLKESPESSEALLGLSKSLLAEGHFEEAVEILDNFPPSRELATAESLRPLAKAMQEILGKKVIIEDPLDAIFSNAIHLVARGNLPAAIDGLLDILRKEKHYNQDRARLVLLGLLEILGDENPLNRQYRNELASVLF
jgi:putative thioredoxin